MLNFLLAITDESQRYKIEYIFENFYKDMLKYANYHLRRSSNNVTESDVEDVVENAFIRLTKYANSIRANTTHEELRMYVLTIVINECNRFFIKKMKFYRSTKVCYQSMKIFLKNYA